MGVILLKYNDIIPFNSGNYGVYPVGLTTKLPGLMTINKCFFLPKKGIPIVAVVVSILVYGLLSLFTLW